MHSPIDPAVRTQRIGEEEPLLSALFCDGLANRRHSHRCKLVVTWHEDLTGAVKRASFLWDLLKHVIIRSKWVFDMLADAEMEMSTNSHLPLPRMVAMMKNLGLTRTSPALAP